MKPFICALSIVCLVTTSPFADDTKLYPGSMGVRWDSTDPFPSLLNGMIQNPSSTSWLRLDLPIVRDLAGFPWGEIKSGLVQVVDMNFELDVQCSLHSLFRSGGSFFGSASPVRSSSGSNVSPQNLKFDSVGSTPLSHYYYSVHIPPAYLRNRSGIVFYRVTEN